MMHVSSALGVNCTYCHNSQSFRAWNLSRAQRGTAYYGIRMVRDINDELYRARWRRCSRPTARGRMATPYKVNCTTCHQGVSKPLGGVSMLAAGAGAERCADADRRAEGGAGAGRGARGVQRSRRR